MMDHFDGYFIFSGKTGMAMALFIVLGAIFSSSVLFDWNLPKSLVQLSSKNRIADPPNEHFSMNQKKNQTDYIKDFRKNDDRNYKTDDLVYQPPINKSLHGDYFKEVNKESLLNLLPDPVFLNRNNINDIIFVTAASAYFYPRLTKLVESIQVYFPAAMLVVYNLGLPEKQLKIVSTFINMRGPWVVNGRWVGDKNVPVGGKGHFTGVFLEGQSAWAGRKI